VSGVKTERLLQMSLLGITVVWWLVLLLRSHGGQVFDDSFMFYRYALHLRSGLGLSWNLDGVPTYGMTSLLWSAVVVVFSFLPFSPAHSLALASWLCSGAALCATGVAVAKNSQSPVMRDLWIIVPLVSLSLLSVLIFDLNAVTGMETMLAFAMVSILAGLVLTQSQRKVSPELIGAVALLLFLVRPESALAASVLISLAALVLPQVSIRSALRSLSVFFGGILLTLILAKIYFHSFFPLSFYLKSAHAYEGYRTRWYPVTSALLFFRAGVLFLLLIAFLFRKHDWRLLAVTGIPLLLTVGYLCTVSQIMGFHSRYYLPYFPLLVIPAFLIFDARLSEDFVGAKQSVLSVPRLVAVMLVVGFVQYLLPQPLLFRLESLAEHRVLSYGDVGLNMNAKTTLPAIDYDRSMQLLADDIVASLPSGATIAASEVGYLGARVPHINVIDLAGLNDNEFALHGFSTNALIRRNPDLVWLPHNDYTYQRGILLTDPAFLDKYELYGGALNYGVAISKTSPYRSLLERQLNLVWQRLYPGLEPEDYLVQSVNWDRHITVPQIDLNVLNGYINPTFSIMLAP